MREFQNHFTESMEQLHLQTTIKTLIFILWQCCNLINNQTSLSYQASWCQASDYTTNHKPFHNNQN
ncbi:hypothetical protein HanIR_Chr17g0893951 [Helianthus annuus]|nr:hypothetical protein HanIR_Chr17g0893951 [Helianthus annuus]